MKWRLGPQHTHWQREYLRAFGCANCW